MLSDYAIMYFNLLVPDNALLVKNVQAKNIQTNTGNTKFLSRLKFKLGLKFILNKI